MRSTRPSFFGIFCLASLALLQILFPTAQPSVVHAFTPSVPTAPCHSRSKSLVLAMTASIDASEQEAMEHVVRTYFDGVNKKDPEQIKACFGDEATIRDVCGIHTSKRNVVAQDLADRCMEFLAAHPDTKVDFHYGYVTCKTACVLLRFIKKSNWFVTCFHGPSLIWKFSHWFCSFFI